MPAEEGGAARRPAPRRRATPSRGAAPVSRKRRRPRSFHFGLAEALARSFAFSGRHLVTTCVVAFVIFAPLGAYVLSCAHDVWNGSDTIVSRYGYEIRMSFWPAVERKTGLLGTAMQAGLLLILQATVTLAVFQFLRGHRVQYPRSFGRGLARLLPVIGVAVLTGLLIIAILFVTLLLLTAVLSPVGGGSGAVILLGIAALAVMAIIYCIFFVAVQAALVEKVGPIRAMARSAWLTSGARWKIFAVVALLFVGSFIARYVTIKAIGARPDTWAQARLGVLLTVGFTALFAAFQAVCATVVYHDLRKAKEGVGIEELMRVFD